MGTTGALGIEHKELGNVVDISSGRVDGCQQMAAARRSNIWHRLYDENFMLNHSEGTNTVYCELRTRGSFVALACSYSTEMSEHGGLAKPT